MRLGGRPVFFAGLAVLSLLMLVPTPQEFRWVNVAAAGLAIFWAVLLFLEDRSFLRLTPKGSRERRPPPAV
jgi:hypothetical protein